MMLITQAASLNRLSLSESDADLVTSDQLQKILRVTVGYSQTSLNSLILSKNAIGVSRETKGEQYSGSAEHYRYSGSAVIQNGCNNENQQVTGKEKGSTENATLWGYGFYHHELNQYLAARQDLQLVRNYSQNLHMLNDKANLRNYKNQRLAGQHIRTCETLVGHRVT
ncbi:TPA: hypothetical protein ACJIVJ_004333, partial [Yersinia enterocolitica]